MKPCLFLTFYLFSHGTKTGSPKRWITKISSLFRGPRFILRHSFYYDQIPLYIYFFLYNIFPYNMKKPKEKTRLWRNINSPLHIYFCATLFSLKLLSNNGNTNQHTEECFSSYLYLRRVLLLRLIILFAHDIFFIIVIIVNF